MLMDRNLFLEQLRATLLMPDSEAQENYRARQGIGQVALIRTIPIRPGVYPQESFWLDVQGRALITDGIGPCFTEVDGASVRGIALWRRQDSDQA